MQNYASNNFVPNIMKQILYFLAHITVSKKKKINRIHRIRAQLLMIFEMAMP